MRGLWNALRKRIVVKIFIIMAYSKKNIMNGPAAYSTLKPDMSSDSASVVRPKGARFVSAREEINHS